MKNDDRQKRERMRMKDALRVAPAEYRIITDQGTFAHRDAPLLASCWKMREIIVNLALDLKVTRAELSTVLLELSASLCHTGMTRETFLKNATLWYDAAATAAARADANAPGGSS